jgi:hypothetical protein
MTQRIGKCAYVRDQCENEGIESRKEALAATTADKATSCYEKVHHLYEINYMPDCATTPD